MNRNALGQTVPEDIAVLESLRRALMPLTYSMEGLQMDMMKIPNSPPDWTTIHRATTTLTSQLRTLYAFLHASRPVSDPSTAPTTNLAAISSLHPYPLPPYPMDTHPQASVASTLIRKRVEPPVETWVAARIRKAAEFAHVPEEWEIDGLPLPKQAQTETQTQTSGDEDMNPEHDDPDAVTEPLATPTRTRGLLTEPQLASVWNLCSSWLVNAMSELSETKAFQDQTPVETPADADMADVDGDGDGDGVGATAVQKLMPLTAVHRFMMTGVVEEN
ncbi:hypothetical protein BDV95DRAFT_188112 [Massariosphaeria phaeospora]|uniref:Uncharacterized protein n=1 Tax=Massariosphaeria phaeospora TaxID=100035 RepID=A0A7C8M3F4_9PLEO|nr:hypothetical protein BDV95DRAFT_188112 [Massariosphaeria phaeospora]